MEISEDNTVPPVAQKVYSVPRRYDLTTLFIVSLAYALVFGVIRAAGGSPETFGIVAGYVTVVGLSQALLFRGNAPRLSSIITGVLFFLAASVVVSVLQGNWYLVALANPCMLSFAALLGYLVGTVIGGVFLVADYCRSAIRRARNSGP